MNFGPFFLFLDGNGVHRAAVGGVGGLVEIGLFLRQSQHGGILAHDAEYVGGGVGAHAAADAAGSIDGDVHGGAILLFLFSPL